VVSLIAAVVVVLHGFLGPDLAPKNLATVAVWVHYRGLLVVGLLAFGNLFCTACPFVLVRDLARRLRAPTRHWPAWLRTKWLGLALLVAVLFAYELLDLWAHPAWTALLVMGYFAVAIVVDVPFKGAAFCKYLCPVGQYNFLASTLSPLELRVKSQAVCEGCVTHDCLLGTAPRVGGGGPPRQRGCELGLFLPRKVGNLDCTLCLDCVHACPHDNIALAPRVPGDELADSGRRSGVGRLGRRRDLAALAVVFTFGALLNAFAMTGPVYGLERWLGHVAGTSREGVVLALIFIFALLIVPGVLLGLATIATRALAGQPRELSDPSARAVPAVPSVMQFVFSLLPLGFGIWLGHYGFHLLTGAFTLLPVSQSAALDLLGWPVLGWPRWGSAGLKPGTVYPVQIGFLLVGLIGSCAVAYRFAVSAYGQRAFRAAIPWIVLSVLVAVTAAWVLSQPMEMRAVTLGSFR